MITLMVIIAIVGLLFAAMSGMIYFTSDDVDSKAMGMLPLVFSLGIFALDGVLLFLHWIF